MKWMSCLFLVFLFALQARGDVLTTVDGKKFEGQVYTSAGKVWVRTPNSRIGFEPNEVRVIQPAPTIFDEYRSRLAAIKKDDLAANEALLKWCEDRGLKEEIRELARRIYSLRSDRLVTEPLDRTAATALAVWCQQYELRTEARNLYLRLYREELKILRADDVSGHLALARWCADRGLQSESRLEYFKVQREEPNNVEARYALGAIPPENNAPYKVAQAPRPRSYSPPEKQAAVADSTPETYPQDTYTYYQPVYPVYVNNVFEGYRYYYGGYYPRRYPGGFYFDYRDRNTHIWSGTPGGRNQPRHDVSGPGPRPDPAPQAPPARPAPQAPRSIGTNGPGYFGF